MQIPQSISDHSWQQLIGRQPPANSPLGQQQFNYQMHYYKEDEIFQWDPQQYTIDQLKQLIDKDWKQDQLNQTILLLKQRKPIKETVQSVENNTSNDLITTNWLISLQQNADYLKQLNDKLKELEVEFNLNHTADFSAVVELIHTNSQQMDNSIQLIIENGFKQRFLYSELCSNLNKQFRKSVYKELINRFENRQSYQDLQAYLNTLSKQDDQLAHLSRRKQHLIGLIEFSCQLFQEKVLEVYFIDEIIQILFKQYFEQKGSLEYIEEPLEFMMKLFQIVGVEYFKIEQSRQDIREQRKMIKRLEIEDSIHFSSKGIISIIEEISQRYQLSQELSIQLSYFNRYLIIDQYIESSDSNQLEQFINQLPQPQLQYFWSKFIFKLLSSDNVVLAQQIYQIYSLEHNNLIQIINKLVTDDPRIIQSNVIVNLLSAFIKNNISIIYHLQFEDSQILNLLTKIIKADWLDSENNLIQIQSYLIKFDEIQQKTFWKAITK